MNYGDLKVLHTDTLVSLQKKCKQRISEVDNASKLPSIYKQEAAINKILQSRKTQK